MSAISRGSTLFGMDHELIHRLYTANGYYHSSEKDPYLVAYAGTYPVHPNDPASEQKQMVGWAYFNLAVIEADPKWLREEAKVIAREVEKEGIQAYRVIGLPEGGKAIALMLAEELGIRYGFPDKKITALATPTSREKSELRYGRHISPFLGEKILLAEDIVNNRSSSLKAYEQATALGANVMGVVCIINRSGVTQLVSGVPILSALQLPTPQCRQDDPRVISLVQQGLVSWKPKDDWDMLIAKMTS